MPRKRTIEPSEHAIQAAFIEWVYRVENLPQYHALSRGSACPVPFDWWLPFATPAYDGLALEFKTRLGRLSKEQRDYRFLLEAANWRVDLVRSTEGAIACVNHYLGVKS